MGEYILAVTVRADEEAPIAPTATPTPTPAATPTPRATVTPRATATPVPG